MSNNQAFYYVDGIPTKGLWIDLDLIDDTDEVLERLAEAELIPRDDEGAPHYGGDLLVADIEGELAGEFYSSQTDSFDLDGFKECLEECDDQEEAAAAFINWYGSWSKSRFQDAYKGQYDNETAFAEQWVENLGLLDSVPENLRYYFDYEKYARDLFINDFYFGRDGHVFDHNC